MKPILEVQHITKKFKIGSKQESYLSLRDIIAKPFKKKEKNVDTFSALDNVSFDVYPGESIGIIGKNGAGKSTMLKILSKITPPSSGKIISRGRVASLLEVGTGFHPELSGRENIYMNGSILGMRKFEIDKHFDEIVDFSGVEKFLDTPLKRYSSGMQLRLAFAVAAYLEPEILIIDEVLAVGDAEFQKKCIGKMDAVSKSGRTVLFVSHDMNAIEQLCRKVIILEKGVLYKKGETHELISNYLNENKIFSFDTLKLAEKVSLTNISFHPEEITSGTNLNFKISIEYEQTAIPAIRDLCLLIYSLKGVRVAVADLREFIKNFKKEENTLSLEGTIENMNLVEGEYSIGLHYNINETRKDIYDVNQIRVKPCLTSSSINPYSPNYRGFLELGKKIKIT
ncbi:MAG TPA: ABC transporter ATP-binding protein [Hanamia sp.]|nr:ABC transporter ATP-binding protein [Hanamia sp.]